MPTVPSLDFPRFLLPAFPRWQPSLLKRHRPVEDVTAEPPRSRPTSSSSAVTLTSDDDVARSPRHARVLSHDSGCVISDDDEHNGNRQDEDEQASDDDRSYTSVSSSTASLEIYLDSESGYGGSTDDIHNSNRKRTRKRSSVPAAPEQSLSSTTSYLHCSTCRTNLCFTSSVISKGFTGRHGRAYLVTNLITANIMHGKPTSRNLQTGAHTVADVSCRVCCGDLGWKYIHAEERSQRYKVGKYILETGRVSKSNVWDADATPATISSNVLPTTAATVSTINTAAASKGGSTKNGATHHDSWDAANGYSNGIDTWDSDAMDVDLADEEELEEMFAGTWNKERATRRRERKMQLDEMRRWVDSNV
ncbi:hypothetical protein TWF696_000913 [Orbilia brochopaga]|uniref:Yippee domain-containing protein n=1 Tax=Orbilia brochopaga TaxID=3140254 RepID=A0AAV9VCR5_9PEZI